MAAVDISAHPLHRIIVPTLRIVVLTLGLVWPLLAVPTGQGHPRDSSPSAVLAKPGRTVVSPGGVRVSGWPQALRPGDVALVILHGVGEEVTVEGAAAGRPLRFFPYADGVAALVGIDLETKPGRHDWKIALVDPRSPPRALAGRLTVTPRQFPVQRLTLPPGMVDLDHATTRRAEAEADRLRTLYRTITADRLWWGRFTLPVAAAGPGEGFGARRIINGKPRLPHSGIDYAADVGTPVVAANSGRVALVADFFFPGRLVALDHGLGLYTLYFHLDSAAIAEGDRVDRGQIIGAVGATGRATGPHLHFGAVVGSARIDPAALLGLKVPD